MRSVDFRVKQQENLPQTRKTQSLTEMFKSTITNISYNIKNSQYIYMPFFTRKNVQIEQKDYAMANLLGKSFSFETKNEFQQRFNKTIWMSYRKINDQGDVGWGCMIRVVQMVFAEVFQRYYPHAKPADLIKLFREENHGPFSLSEICRKGNIEKRYTSSPQIYSIMTSLVQQSKTKLKINLNIENYCNTIHIKSEDEYKSSQFPKLISVLAKAQLNDEEERFQEEYMSHLLSMMKDPSFCGIAAGVNNEALYVVGQYNGLAIILDPHYVQTQEKEQTYFQKIPKGVDFTELKSTFTINFYFQNLETFGEWVDNVMLMEKVWAPYTCFSTQIKNSEGWVKNHRKKSQDFQNLA